MAALMFHFLFFVIVTIVFSPIVDSASPAQDQKEQKFTPRIQIRAILIRCPQHIIPDNKVRGGGNSNDDKVISVLRTDDIMRFSGFDKDELLMHSEVKNCKRKMIITMMINNFGRTVTEEEFVVVDHVYDPDLHKRSRLLNPFVFKIKQDAVLQLYGMRYLQSVNAMAREEVLNKGMNNFTGCDTASSQPTCGMVYHNNRVVPFSEGFCCSCDSYVNLQRQPGLSLVRQQKMFSNRKENHFVDEKDSVDYSHQQSKRDINRQSKRDIDRQMNRQSKDEDIENRDNLLKKSNNLDVLRSKYMSSDFDFAKNGFYTPQIVRKNRLSGDNFNKFSNPEEVRSWEHRGRLYDVGDKGGRILWNNENFEQIPSEEEENGGEKKRRSVDEKGIVDKEGGKKNEPKVGLDIVEKGIEKGGHLRDESKPKLNTGMFDENVGMKNRRDVNSEALHELGENEEKEIVDESSEMKEYLGVDGRFDVSLTENSGEIVDENGGMEERRGVVNDQEQVINSLNSEEGTFDEGVSKARLYNGGVGVDEVSGNKEPWNGDENLRDVENGIVEGGLKNIKERSVHDDLDSLIRNSMRVTDEKPFLLKPKDWTSLKALKLRVKGAKPNSPQFKGTYQPAHRYVKVLEENPVLENAKGFQMSDYRPRWNPNAKVSFKKPTPWEVIPKKCASDKRNKSILRILTKLNEERCHPDPFGEEDSKVFDSLMRSIEKKLVRSCRSNVNETNNNFDNNSTIIMNNRSQCEEAWSELQTLLLEQAIDEKLTLHDRKQTTNESSILLNEGDKKVIDRLKRQITRWVDHNYELDLSNIYNNSSFNNEGGVLLPLNGDYLYYVDSVRNFENGLGRLHESPDNLYGISSEIDVRKNPQNFVNNSEKVPGLKDVEFLSEEDASGLNEFGERYRHGLGLVSSAGKSEPDSNYVENFGKSIPNEQSKIYDENKYLKNLSNDNIALKYTELPSEEKIGGNYYTDNKVNDDQHVINNIGKEISATNEFHLNPPLHFHSDSGPVFIDVSKYGPLLDTLPIKLSKSSPHPYSLLPNDLSFINPQEFDKTRNDVPNKFTMKSNIPAKSYLDVGLEDNRMLSARNFELVEKNHDKADIKLDENSKKMNDYSAENTINLSNYNWNFKGKYDPSLQYYKVIDNKNSFLLDNNSNFNKHSVSIDRNFDSNLNKLIDSKNPFLRDNNSFFNKNSLAIDRNSDPNLNNVDDFSNLNIENDVNQNPKNYVDRNSRLEYEGLGVNRGSNLYNIEDENPNNLPNNAIAFDDMPIPNNYSSYLSKNNNLSHKTYHIYKQEMESPYIINTSHAKHMPNFQVLKTSGEDTDRRLHYLEVATEFGYPPMLNTTDMQYLMQNALHSGDASENLTSVSKNAMKSSDIENVKTSVPQERLMTNGSKSGPILISGNVGNIYGQKGKLIFIPDESEEPVTAKTKIDYQYLQNVNQKLSYPTSESNISYPDSETCNIGKPPPGYGISLNSGRNNVNSKLFPSFLKNSYGNPDRNYLETNLLKDENSQISLNSHKPQMNLVNNKLDYGLNIKCNLHADDLNKPLNNKIDGNFDTKNAQEKYDKLNFGSLNNFPKNSLDKYGYKDGENGNDGGDKIEKRDTEQIESRSKKISKKVRRQVSSNGNQIRGGQNCIDRYVPSGANPITYHESAHCLRFSDLWYSIFTLKKPNLDHSLHLQLFEKANFPHSTHWEELTRGITTDLGTGNRHIEDGMSTLSFTYIPLTDLMHGDFCLDEHRATLLVPEPLPPNLAAKYPQLTGSPNEYLLVQSDDISLEGDECNKVGTSFEGFATQPDRCAQPRGTCLQNQPIDMWTHDIMARDEGRPGKFFLENYAIVAEQPLLMNHSSQEQSLALEYYRQFSTIIEIEVKSDLNAIVRTGESGQLSEVYVDSTCHSNTKLTVVVTNQGLAASAYYPKLANCPVELPEVWTHNVGPLVTIAPQHRHIFQMTMYGELPVDRFHCSVELLNDKRELVATRRVRIQKHDRCVCVWHCLCACTASTDGLSCAVMSLSHYHAAGFQGSLPVISGHPETRGERLLKILLPLLILVAFSLVLGLIKAILGLCFSIVGAYGLWAVCKKKSKNLPNYKEDDLKDFDVEHDLQSFAIHPVTQTRNIKLFDKLTEFFINIFFVFLLLWELVLCIICCRCWSEDGKLEEEDENDDDEESSNTSDESDLESNELEDESVTVNSVIEERRRCEEDLKGYNVEVTEQCLIYVRKPGDKSKKTKK